jgi:hypothetical protein
VRRWLGREKEVEGRVNKRRGSARSVAVGEEMGVEVSCRLCSPAPYFYHCLRPPWTQAVSKVTVGTGIII